MLYAGGRQQHGAGRHARTHERTLSRLGLSAATRRLVCQHNATTTLGITLAKIRKPAKHVNVCVVWFLRYSVGLTVLQHRKGLLVGARGEV